MKSACPRSVILSASSLLSVFLLSFAVTPSARANITAQWDEAAKTRTITRDADDDIVVSGEPSDPDHRGVLINGNMYILPTFGTLDPLVVEKIVVKGGPGDDFLDGGLGHDELDGEAGNNTPIFDSKGLNATRTDSMITLPGYAPVTFFNFTEVRIVERAGLTPQDVCPPGEFCLFQNYRNPFNLSTSIGFSPAPEGSVSVQVYDVMCRLVAVLAARRMAAGVHRLEWNASGLCSGVYFCTIQAGGFKAMRKMALMK